MGNEALDRVWFLQEDIYVDAAPDLLFDAVSGLQRMGEWSPECRVAWVPFRPIRLGRRFVGFNRKKFFFWFTFCRVTNYEKGKHFSFSVSVFGLPVAEWGYQFSLEGGGTRVTEYWHDRRIGPGAALANALGAIFTGTPALRRADSNKKGMRVTLRCLKRSIECAQRYSETDD